MDKIYEIITSTYKRLGGTKHPLEPEGRTWQQLFLSECMKEYGKLMYNQAIDDAAKVTDEKMRRFGSTNGYFITQLKKQ